MKHENEFAPNPLPCQLECSQPLTLFLLVVVPELVPGGPGISYY